MVCYYPIPLDRPKLKRSDVPPHVHRPCGKCIGCRLDTARMWAVRCIHESSCHDQNIFVTLTYNDAHLPGGATLVKSHLQKFMRRLRKFFAYPGCIPDTDKIGRIQYYTSTAKKYSYRYGQPKTKPVYRDIKFFACGEYGERLGRPHYHAILFGVDFVDKVPIKIDSKRYFANNRYQRPHDFDLYKSETLSKLWGKGFVSMGSVTMDSAGYVARYNLKKIFGENQEKHYGGKEPEFALMSRRPGIGHKWFTKYTSDIFPKGFFTINGSKMQPPRYYDELLKRKDECLYEKIKKDRWENSKDKDMDWAKNKRKEKYKKLITKPLERKI